MNPPEPSSSVIPEITDPMGAHWRQPSREGIELDATHALMDEQTFNALSDYSCSYPSGVYPGKMWKRRQDFHDPSKGWLLCWYAPSDRERYCSINYREILPLNASPIAA